MTSERHLLKLEREIKVKMNQIKLGKTTPKDSGIGRMINLMKDLDEPLYDKILVEYKEILKSIK